MQRSFVISTAFVFLTLLFSLHSSSSENVTISRNHDIGGGDVTIATRDHQTENDTDVTIRCMVKAVDPFMPNTIKRLLKEEKVSLIEYRLIFSNYTTNPLSGNTLTAYKLDKWSRVTTSQGQTLLSLAFNYGVLSMATLTLGTQVLEVDLQDQPPGCIKSAKEKEKIEAIKYLLLRDFQESKYSTLVDEERVCHEVILSNDGYAMFRDMCYYPNPNTKEIMENDNSDNIWLTILYVLLFLVRYSLIFFGPVLFITSIERMSSEQIPYVVKLKDTLKKTIYLTNKKNLVNEKDLKPKKVVNLNNLKGFPKLQDTVSRNQSLIGRPVKVKFSQYDITVNYRRLLTENTVEVGLLQSLYAAIFRCEIRTVGPFQGCCKANMCLGCPCTKRNLSWIKFFRKVSKASMVILVPVPYYVRLIVYYLCEHEEIMLRKSYIERAGLREKYETTSSLMHYLTPTHPFFICIYVVYALTAIVLAVLPKRKREGRLLKIIVGSFRDLKTLSWTETLSMVTSNAIWPLKRFGMLGCVVGLVYWPIALPITLIVAGVYLIPTLYLTVRMAFYSKTAIFERMRRRKKNKPYQINVKTDKDMHRFEAALLLDKPKSEVEEKTTLDQQDEIALDEIDNVHAKSKFETIKDNISLASSIILYQTTSWRRLLMYAAIAVLCIATLYGVMIILSEVIGCLVEIVVFTIMGVIVNASALLKYVMLVLMIFVYCCDCFNNVHKKYIKLNKALFGEIKGRIKNLADITSLPSALQENHGFKCQELSEQAEYESPDDIADRPMNYWQINDLCLFVDSEDMPRIPKLLFDKVCQIRVAGVPGPVYRGLIEAMEQLLKIIAFIVFVFIVVLTFGSVYKVSTTNQMLATMVGGFLPMVLKTFMAPPSPDIEIGTVSFKSKLDEVIKNFDQGWPIYDLPFTVITEEEEAAAAEKKTDGASPQNDATVAAPTSSCHQDSSGVVVVMDTADDIPAGVISDHSFSMFPTASLFPLRNTVNTEPVQENNNNNNPPPTENGINDRSKSEPETEIKTTRFADPPVTDGCGSQTEVDILIYMPDKYEETWLDEWSDMNSMNP